MEIEYQRDLNKSYMILTKEQEEDPFELFMLEHNRIEDLLPFKRDRKGKNLSLWYDISSRQSLDCYLEMNPLDREFLCRFLRTLDHLGEILQPFLLDENHILLNPETVYVKNDGSGFGFCYFPAEGGNIREGFQELIEFLLQKVDHRNEDARSAAYGIYQKITSEEYSLTQLLSDMEEETDPEEEVFFPEENPEVPKQRVINYPEEIPKKSKRRLFAVMEKRKKEEPEPVFPTEEEKAAALEEKTTFISLEEEEARGELRYLGHGSERNLLIQGSPFFIGTREGLMGRLDSQAVSRQHAKITKTPEGYVLEDLNSTNGTQRNGKNLKYREKVLLKPKDHILFADEEFLFL